MGITTSLFTLDPDFYEMEQKPGKDPGGSGQEKEKPKDSQESTSQSYFRVYPDILLTHDGKQHRYSFSHSQNKYLLESTEEVMELDPETLRELPSHINETPKRQEFQLNFNTSLILNNTKLSLVEEGREKRKREGVGIFRYLSNGITLIDNVSYDDPVLSNPQFLDEDLRVVPLEKASSFTNFDSTIAAKDNLTLFTNADGDVEIYTLRPLQCVAKIGNQGHGPAAFLGPYLAIYTIRAPKGDEIQPSFISLHKLPENLEDTRAQREGIQGAQRPGATKTLRNKFGKATLLDRTPQLKDCIYQVCRLSDEEFVITASSTILRDQEVIVWRVEETTRPEGKECEAKLKHVWTLPVAGEVNTPGFPWRIGDDAFIFEDFLIRRVGNSYERFQKFPPQHFQFSKKELRYPNREKRLEIARLLHMNIPLDLGEVVVKFCAEVIEPST